MPSRTAGMKRKKPVKPRTDVTPPTPPTPPVPAAPATPELHVQPALQRAIAAVRAAIGAMLDLADRTAEAVFHKGAS